MAAMAPVGSSPAELPVVAGGSMDWASFAGLGGSLLMFIGDILLYGPEAFGHSATGSLYFDRVDPAAPVPALLSALNPMVSTPQTRAVIGGLLGPLAGLLYVAAGAGQFIRREHGAAGWFAGIGHCVAMMVVSCYHAAYPYTSFIARQFVTCEAELSEATNAHNSMQCSMLEGVMHDHVVYLAAMKLVVGWVVGTIHAAHALTSSPQPPHAA